MDMVRLGIIGVGGMGSGHLRNFLEGKWKDIEVTALCDIDAAKLEAKRAEHGDRFQYFEKAEDLMSSGAVDAILIATPHYLHPVLAIEGFKHNLHVMSEKPAGVYTKAVREMNEAAAKTDRVFGVMFNQRTNPAYRKMKEMIESGEMGEVLRVNWIITNWFRTQAYYDNGGWRATWKGEGGGVLVNQDPHQIDLMQWICGMPKRVRASAYCGKYHNIEVEDDVTAYFEYENGATGLFITTTGEQPGTNRLEISLDRGKMVFEGTKLQIWKTDQSIKEFRENAKGGFAKMNCETSEINFDNSGEQHVGIINDFAQAILTGKPLLAPGVEGIRGVTIANAIHLSSWTDNWVELPIDEDLFYQKLQEKIANSTSTKSETDTGKAVDLAGTY